MVPSSVQRFVHHVPSADPPFISADHGPDVVVHAVEQGLTGQRFALVILKDPSWRLAVPHQAMANNEHFVLLAEGDVAVGRVEIVAVRTRVYGLPLEPVLGADGAKLRRDDGVTARVAFLELGRVQGSPDSEDVLMGSLERRSGLALGDGVRQSNLMESIRLGV